MIFTLGFLQFSHGFEFITVYVISVVCMNWIAAILRSEKAPLRESLTCFLTLVSSFITSLGLLIVAQLQSREDRISFLDAVSNILDRIVTRNISENGVPQRLSADFFSEMYRRWNLDGFSFLNLMSLSQFGVVVIFLSFLSVRKYRLKKLTQLDLAIVVFSFGSYSSWYLFGYQHIMWHYMYDWYIFSLTVGLGTLCLGAVTLSRYGVTNQKVRSN